MLYVHCNYLKSRNYTNFKITKFDVVGVLSLLRFQFALVISPVVIYTSDAGNSCITPGTCLNLIFAGQ